MSSAALFTQTATERVHIGTAAAEAVVDEARRNEASRVFLVVSATLDRQTDEIAHRQE